MRRLVLACLLASAVTGSALALAPARSADAPAAPACGPGPLVLTGAVTEADAKTYHYEPFTVPPGVGRVAVSYSWVENRAPLSTPLTATTVDLGLWDDDGHLDAAGFRGWSGSRQRSVFVQADAAARGYLPGPVEPGTWWVELGIAAVAPGGAQWTATVTCGPARAEAVRTTGPFPDDHVARPGPGWYHGDFHMHGYHSAANGPDWPAFVAQARAAGLDFLPVTEYVTPAHWAELGPVQAQHPDLLVWPGREIITYFGHASSLGVTPGVIEYRHGFGGVSLGDVQEAVKDAGGLFQVNHPTTFPGPVFQNFCRGCEFTLGDDIDWRAVDTIEVLTGPAVARPSDAGAPASPAEALEGENPFMDSAVELWESLLARGYRIAPVSGSDSKGNDPPAERARKGYGSSATAVYAEQLSLGALEEAIEKGRVYVRARGVHGSPALDMRAATPAGKKGTFGDTLRSDTAELTITVTGGVGQVLRVIANGSVVYVRPVAEDVSTVTVPIFRVPATEGPLGTFWRVETLDARSRTTIGNALFLAEPKAKKEKKDKATGQ